MSVNKLTTAALAVLLVLAAAGPVAAADGSATAGDEVSQSITVTMTTTEDGTLVTFEQGGEAYADATVDVEAVGDASYAGSGSYETDADGSVHLPAPDQDVTVRIAVETDDARASGVVVLSSYHGVETETTVTIEAETAGQASADGSEEANGDSSAADGSDDARSNGSASAEARGGAEASADANGDGSVSLGERLSAFVRGIARVDLGGVGEAVSGFAIGNNPSDADDGAEAGADVNAGADASASAEAGNGSVGVEAGGGDGDAGVGVTVSAGGEASGSSETSSDARSTGETGAEGSGETNATVNGEVTASGSANANDSTRASGEVGASWFAGLFPWI